MIVPATSADFAALISGQPPAPWRLVDDSAISPPEVLQMLSDLADSIRPAFDPAAWLIVEGGEVVGLLSLVRPIAGGEICIGYGVAPTRRGRGATTAALADLLEWARRDHRIERVIAETNHDNTASQRVLESNGFTRIGERVDEEDGALIVWQALVT